MAELEKRLEEGEEAESAQAQQGADTPEDFWSPVSAPLSVGAVDDYGALQPAPAHDGTECLKWDDSLWSHADHFKVPCSAHDMPCLPSLTALAALISDPPTLRCLCMTLSACIGCSGTVRTGRRL